MLDWGALYDLLEGIEGVSKVVLSHPAKNRIIADAQIKNDRVDALYASRYVVVTL